MRQAHRAQGDALRHVALLALAFALLACTGPPDPGDATPPASPTPSLVPRPVATLDLRDGDLVARGALAVNPATRRVYQWMATPGGDQEEVWVIDGGTLETTARIEVPGGCAAPGAVAAVAVDQVRNRVYVTGCDADAVWVIDGARDAVVGALSVRAARDVVLDAARARVYVHSADRIVVLDAETGDTAGRIDLEPVHAFDVDTSTGRVAALVDGGEATVIVDPDTLQPVGMVHHEGSAGAAVTVDPRSHRVFVYTPGSHGVSVVDGARAADIGLTQMPDPVTSIAVDGLRGLLIVASAETASASFIEAASIERLAVVPLASGAVAVAIDEPAGRAYVWGAGGIAVLDVDVPRAPL